MDTQDWLTSRPIAHRGLFDNKLVPENSIRSFDLAISLNHPIEFDVRLTKDGKPIVFHDRSLFRMTGRNWPVSRVSWDEIRSIPLLGTNQTVPTLAYALEFINGRVPVLVEIKNEGCSHCTEEATMEALQRYSGNFAIQSFNPFSLSWIRKRFPEVCVGLLATGLPRKSFANIVIEFAFRAVGLYSISSPKFVAYNVSAGDIRFFEDMKKRLKVPLILWTIDSTEKRNICQKLGINYIFEQSAMTAEA